MAFSINQNISALNTHRNLQISNARLTRSLENLSSGVKINHASEGPASLQISEHFRAQIGGIQQSIENSEIAISLVQTTESALSTVNSHLVKIRSLLLNSANEGVHNQDSLAINKTEIEFALDAITRISKEARFGEKVLLDGSNEASIYTTGDGLEYDSATVLSKNSGKNGYEVKILSNATKSKINGIVGLTQEMVERGEELFVIENGIEASYITTKNDTVDTAFKNLQDKIRNRGLQVELSWNEEGIASISHKKYGTRPHFEVSSTTAGVLSQQGGTVETATSGTNINGTINGAPAKGEGQLLSGLSAVENIDGIRVRYTGEVGKEGSIPPNGESVGRVYVTQKSWHFKVNGTTDKSSVTGLSTLNVDPTRLAQNVKNDSHIENLGDISVDTFQKNQDSLLLVDRAIDQISKTRGDLGSFQKFILETNLLSNRISNENLTSAESFIRDTDMAKEVAELTRNQIVNQAGIAMLAHANQSPARLMQALQ